MKDQTTIDYRAFELTRVSDGDDHKLKITSDTGETRWLNINKFELSMIINVLVGDAS